MDVDLHRCIAAKKIISPVLNAWRAADLLLVRIVVTRSAFSEDLSYR
jgi:hypothetical protein